MSNPQQNEIQKKIEQIKTEINLLLLNLSKPKKKKECIAKWTKANCKNANQKKTESIPNWKNVQ